MAVKFLQLVVAKGPVCAHSIGGLQRKVTGHHARRHRPPAVGASAQSWRVEPLFAAVAVDEGGLRRRAGWLAVAQLPSMGVAAASLQDQDPGVGPASGQIGREKERRGKAGAHDNEIVVLVHALVLVETGLPTAEGDWAEIEQFAQRPRDRLPQLSTWGSAGAGVSLIGKRGSGVLLEHGAHLKEG